MGGPAIVFVHRGWTGYLTTALRRAVAVGGAPVWLITDCPRHAGIPGVRLADLADLAGLAAGMERFTAAYRHLSTNPERFELFCWQRWFLVEALVRREGLDGVLHLDSDVLLCAPAAAFAAPEGLALCRPEAPAAVREGVLIGAASGHCSWWTSQTLEDFCAFAEAAFRPGPLLDRFVAKWEHHRAHGLGGGVCDMTGLMLFAATRPCANLLVPDAEGVVDDNIHTATNREPGEYRTAFGLKRIRFRAGRPCLLRRRDGGEVPAKALHFQGDAKPLMRACAAGRWSLARIAAWRVAMGVNRACHRLVGGGLHGRLLRMIWRRLRGVTSPAGG